MESPAPGRYPFGLSADQETRAARLHADSIVVDAQCMQPGGTAIFDELPPDLFERAFGKTTGRAALLMGAMAPFWLAAKHGDDTIRRWWRMSGVDVGHNWVGTQTGWADAVARPGLTWIHELDWIRPVTTVRQIRENKKNDVVSLWGYDQPLFGIPNDPTAIDRAYAEGLRTLMLTYNRMDYVGQGCTERVDAGLSNYGIDVVRRCNDLGIVVDTSHCGKRTTLDACEFSTTPVLANHTTAEALHPHARAKSDEEIRAIAATGGVVGIVTVPFFLSPDPEPTIEAMLDHIEYVAKLVGARHVGIGTDWPFQQPAALLEATLGGMLAEIGFRPEDKVAIAATLVGFRDYRDMPNVTRGLVKRGYSDTEIAGILGENYLRVYERVCG